MKKIISFSLWGDKPIYNFGFLHNYGLSKKFYSDWDVVLYYDDTVLDIVKDFITSKNIIAFDMTGEDLPGEFWRFLANDLESVSHVVFRDCDSRLSLREKLAVDEWVGSDDIIHVMRDHPAHRIPLGVNGMGMLAGMWGIKTNNINMKEMLGYFVKNNQLKWGSDQTFIYEIYNKFKSSMTLHDPLFSNKPFPIGRQDKHYVGERVDENNKRVNNDHLVFR
tara:strand:- start:5815 stop:6477 length:663 start_codon:yes stop_codon:yes gene_type:complete